MKTDATLGQDIHRYLVSKGVESPIDFDVYNSRSSKQKIKQIEKHVKKSLEIIGFDFEDDSIQNTPHRVAKMWVDEIMKGLDYNYFPKIMTFNNKFESSGMVVERDVKSMSLCSHHLVTIDGVATVAYIPDKKIIGLSKINRVVEFFSRRPQEAERLTLQIFYALEYILETENIAVFLDGIHYCVKSRGVGDVNSYTSTVKLGGGFLNDPSLRKEFFDVVHSSKR